MLIITVYFIHSFIHTSSSDHLGVDQVSVSTLVHLCTGLNAQLCTGLGKLDGWGAGGLCPTNVGGPQAPAVFLSQSCPR